jgi:DivIVA domain-containing protein
MTLSLDDVRNKRFRMARKSGYEVLEVDEFVDEVEATFEQLFEENKNLKKQVDSLKGNAAAPAPAAVTSGAPATSDPATSAPTVPAAPAAAAPAERIVVTTSKDASSAVVRLVELSTEQSERLVAEAEAEAKRIREEASTSAERVETEARTEAERLQADVRSRSEALDHELETRRAELFGNLEKQREQLTATVNALRAFEATYRSNLTTHLQSQIDVLASGSEEPTNPPAALAESTAHRTNGATPVAGEGAIDDDGKAQDARTGGDAEASADDTLAGASDTPRLDALLGDQR